MARKTKAQLAAEAAAEEETPDEVDALLQAGYEAGESEDNWEVDEDDLAALDAADEAGDYDAFKADVTILCTKSEKLVGNDSGDPYIKLTWVVQDGPHEKAHIWDLIMLRGKGLGFAKKKLNQLGLSVQGLNPKAFENLLVTAKTKIQQPQKGTDYDAKTVIAKYTGRVGDVVVEDLPE